MNHDGLDWALTGVHLVDPAQNIDGPRDLWIRQGILHAIEMPGAAAKWLEKGQVVRVVDRAGYYVAPGFVDIHVHLREPGQEYKETVATGTKAAVAGGFTSVLCMANTNPVNDNPYVTKYILSQIRDFAHCRVYPVGALSKGLKGQELAEIGKMRDAGIRAVSDDGIPVMNSYLMRKALDYCKAFELTIISHAEDANLVGQGVMHEGFHSCCLGLRGIPAESEEILVARDIALARLTGGHVHFAHISTRQALVHIRRAKAEGIRVTAEVTPHHLIFKDEDVSSYDSSFKMAPPLRTQTDIEALEQALADGTLDCVATDHAPHAPRDKDVLFEFAANGVVGLETAFGVVMSLVQRGILTMTRAVEVLSRRPAEIVGLADAGHLTPCAPADIVIFDPKGEFAVEEESLHSKSKNTPFLGKTLPGTVFETYVGGRCVYRRSEGVPA